MNREIKFRAWDKNRKIIVDVEHLGKSAIGYKFNTRKGNITTTHYKSKSRGYFNLMQYTGLKDKNGKEIYEGDIVRTALGHPQVIVWSDMYAAFVAEYPNGDRPYRVDCTDEVIGNIHENPELLEVHP